MRIGIDLGGTKTEAIALANNGQELARLRVPTISGSYDATLSTVRELVTGLENRFDRNASVGIGIPGTISPASGLVKNANSTWLIGRPLDQDLEKVLGRPVRIANDADCFTLSEATDGAGADAEIVFGVILGTGVGGGISVRRKLIGGPNAIAGEWGHNPLSWPQDNERPGPDCYCGKKGCIETFLSGPGLARDYALASGNSLSPFEIVANAQAGDAQAEAALTRYEDRLARALAAVINILDPDVVVVGGGLSNVTRIYENLPRLLPAHVFSDCVATRILPPRFGDSSGVRGAAWLWNR